MRFGLFVGSGFGGEVAGGALRGWVLRVSDGGWGCLVRPSELASPCPVRRDVWLLRNGFRLGGEVVGRGCGYHREVLGVFRAVVGGGWGGVREVVEGGLVRSHAGAWALGACVAWLNNGCVPPISVEPTLPPVLGFTPSKPDLVVGSSPVELAYSPWGVRGRYVRRKEVEVAAYALILEAVTGAPVDTGWLVVITDEGVEVREVLVDEGLREEALRAREEVEGVVTSRMPPQPPASCPQSCPFRSECLGGGARGVEVGVEVTAG